MADQTLTYDPDTNTFRVSLPPDPGDPPGITRWAIAATQAELDALVHVGTTAPDPALVMLWQDTTTPTAPVLKGWTGTAWVPATEATGLATKAQRLTRTAVKTANYTAAAGELVPVDTTSGNVTVTLPTAPADGSRVAVKHVVAGASRAVTIARGGSSDVFNKAGGSTSVTLTLLNQAVNLQYDAGVWTVVSDDLPKAALDAAYAPFQWVNLLAGLGDSIMASDSPDVRTKGGNFFEQLCARSLQRCLSGPTSTHQGYTAAQGRSLLLPSILTASPKPAACVVLLGTNGGPTDPIATTMADLIGIWTDLKAAGIRPIACTIPPQNTAGTVAQIAQLNAAIKLYAARAGMACLDLYAQLADPVTGQYLAGMSIDNVHPSKAGHAAMAAYAAPVLSAMFGPSTPYLAHSQKDYNLFPNGFGLFLAGGAVSGNYGVGFSDFSSDTPAHSEWSLTTVGSAGTPAIKGNWQQGQRANTATGNATLQGSGGNGGAGATAPVVVGNKIAIAFRFQTEANLSGGLAVTIGADFLTGGGATIAGQSLAALSGWVADIADGVAYIEGIVPATSATVRPSITLGTTTDNAAKVRVGQFTVIDLTACGIAA